MPQTEHLGHTRHQEEDRLLTVADIAEKLLVDQTTVRRWIKAGALEAVTLPHVNKRCAYRIKQSTLERLLTVSTLAEAIAV